MEKVDILIRTLEPEIDAKCAEIRQKKSERQLTGLFVAVSALMLVIPTMLVFFGASLFSIFVPIIFVGIILLATSPILMSKGAVCYE